MSFGEFASTQIKKADERDKPLYIGKRKIVQPTSSE